MSLLTKARQTLDGWLSVAVGLGTTRDKVQTFEYYGDGDIPSQTLDLVYEQDPLAAKIVEKPAAAMLRGFRVSVDPDMQDDVDLWLDEWSVRDLLFESLVWEALFGGSAIVLGVEDGMSPQSPFNPAYPYRLKHLTSVDRHMLSVREWANEPGSTYYGSPLTYAGVYSTNPQPIHRSRMVLFTGLPVSKRRRRERDGWGVSVIQRCWDALRSYNANWLAAQHLMVDGSQGIFKIKDLFSMLASGNEQLAKARVEIADRMRSVARALVLDRDTEEFTRQDTNMSGIPDFLDRNLVRVATAADIPVSILAGRAVVALGGNDDSSLRQWYDRCEGDRDTRLTPRVKEFMQIVFGAQNGPTGGRMPNHFSVEYDNLWQPTESEEASIRKTEAETLNILTSMNAINQYEARAVAKRRLQLDEDAGTPSIAAAVRGYDSMVRADAESASPGYCVWLPVDPDDLRLPDGLVVEGPLHITLGWFPSLAVAPERLIAVLEKLPTRPIGVSVAGWAVFDPIGSSKRPLVALVDSPSVSALHQRLMSMCRGVGISAPNAHPYVPHITLDYVDGDTVTLPKTQRHSWVQHRIELVQDDAVLYARAL